MAVDFLFEFISLMVKQLPMPTGALTSSPVTIQKWKTTRSLMKLRHAHFSNSSPKKPAEVPTYSKSWLRHITKSELTNKRHDFVKKFM